MPRVRALRDFVSTVHGNVSTGDRFNMEGKRFEAMKAAGYVEEIQADPLFSESAAPLPPPAPPKPAEPAAQPESQDQDSAGKQIDEAAPPAPQRRARRSQPKD